MPELIASARYRNGFVAHPVEDSEIVNRCMLALAAEGQNILDDSRAISMSFTSTAMASRATKVVQCRFAHT